MRYILVVSRGWQIMNWEQLTRHLSRLRIPIAIDRFKGSLDSIAQLACVNLLTNSRCELMVSSGSDIVMNQDAQRDGNILNLGAPSVALSAAEEDCVFASMLAVAAALAYSGRFDLYLDGNLQELEVLRTGALGLLGESAGVDLRSGEAEQQPYFDPIVYAYWKVFLVAHFVGPLSIILIYILISFLTGQIALQDLLELSIIPVGFAAVGLLAFVLVSVGLILAAIIAHVLRTIAVWADIRFARNRFQKHDKRSQSDLFCLMLRSTQADAALSLYSTNANPIYDTHPLRIDAQPGFRQLLSDKMQPFYSLLIKNDQQIRHGVSLTYPESEWKQHVVRDMVEAEFILFVPTWPSEALSWELAQIKKLNLFSKTFLVMPPSALTRPPSDGRADFSIRRNSQVAFLGQALIRVLFPRLALAHASAINDIEQIKLLAQAWEQTRPMLKAAGLDPPAYAPSGAFVLCESIAEQMGPPTALQSDYQRILGIIGYHDWHDARGKYLASVVRQPNLNVVA